MALLIHNSFPYSEIDLTRVYDWQLAQELKERFCTVIEVRFHNVFLIYLYIF